MMMHRNADALAAAQQALADAGAKSKAAAKGPLAAATAMRLQWYRAAAMRRNSVEQQQ